MGGVSHYARSLSYRFIRSFEVLKKVKGRRGERWKGGLY